MSNEPDEGLTEEELDRAEGEQLPDREEMAAIPLPDPTGAGGFTLPVEPPADK
jgi:hypothetical protein